MPVFLTLRDWEGNALATAMLPPDGKDRGGSRIIIVAASNADPYPEQDAAIAALERISASNSIATVYFPYSR
jgi:hypothetical protein